MLMGLNKSVRKILEARLDKALPEKANKGD